jgi:hypothetical protein
VGSFRCAHSRRSLHTLSLGASPPRSVLGAVAHQREGGSDGSFRSAHSALRRLAPGHTGEALLHFSTALRRFADAKGASGKYHETLTVGYMLLVADRLGEHPHSSWTEFAAANPDLFLRSPSPLTAFYTEETLKSERSRSTFVMPDRITPTQTAAG